MINLKNSAILIEHFFMNLWKRIVINLTLLKFKCCYFFQSKSRIVKTLLKRNYWLKMDSTNYRFYGTCWKKLNISNSPQVKSSSSYKFFFLNKNVVSALALTAHCIKYLNFT